MSAAMPPPAAAAERSASDGSRAPLEAAPPARPTLARKRSGTLSVTDVGDVRRAAAAHAKPVLARKRSGTLKPDQMGTVHAAAAAATAAVATAAAATAAAATTAAAGPRNALRRPSLIGDLVNLPAGGMTEDLAVELSQAAQASLKEAQDRQRERTQSRMKKRRRSKTKKKGMGKRRSTRRKLLTEEQKEEARERRREKRRQRAQRKMKRAAKKVVLMARSLGEMSGAAQLTNKDNIVDEEKLVVGPDEKVNVLKTLVEEGGEEGAQQGEKASSSSANKEIHKDQDTSTCTPTPNAHGAAEDVANRLCVRLAAFYDAEQLPQKAASAQQIVARVLEHFPDENAAIEQLNQALARKFGGKHL